MSGLVHLLFAALIVGSVGAQDRPAFALPDQNPSPAAGRNAAPPAATPGDEIATAPQQLRRVPPPSPEMTPEQLENQADLLRARKEYADAVDYYKAALAKDRRAILYNKMGMAELMMLRYDDAKKDFERATKLDKHYAEAWNNLGVIYYIRNNQGKAIKYYKKALELKDSASYHSNMGTALFAKQKYPEASSEYLRALQLDPDIFDRTSTAGVSARLTSDRDRAHFSYLLAKMFALRGDNERSLHFLRKAMEDGYKDIQRVYEDKEFEKLRRDPRFLALMADKPPALPN